MAHRSFDFTIDGKKSWAQGHANTRAAVTLLLQPLANVAVSAILTPAEARAMANALYQAADYAESTLATGLGESEVAA